MTTPTHHISRSTAINKTRRRAIRLTIALALIALGILALSLPTALGFPSRSANAISTLGDCEISVHVINLDRAIDPVSERYLLRELAHTQDPYADERQKWDDAYSGSSMFGPGVCVNDGGDVFEKIDRGDLVVIVLDTPGGLLDSTRAMVNAILESRVPIVVYVSPSGAHAASAGTFIGAAANILAMAPVTEIGGAAVVGGQGEDLGATMKAKANEDAAALLRGIADKRGRNVEALEATVFEAKAYSAEEAVEIGIADVVVEGIDELLHWLDGKTVETAEGPITFEGLQHAQIEESQYTIWDRFLGAIANPNLAFLLISLGSLALIVELWNFGSFIPGTIGVLLLLLGFAGVGQLPFQWAGIVLIFLAAELLVAPGFGFFGIASVIALILGGIFLFPFPPINAPELPGGQIQVSRWLLAGIGTVALLFVIWLIRELRLAARPGSFIPSGTPDTLIGTTAHVTKALEPDCEVYTPGEHWSAHTPERTTIQTRQTVKITQIEGVTLIVEPETDDD